MPTEPLTRRSTRRPTVVAVVTLFTLCTLATLVAAMPATGAAPLAGQPRARAAVTATDPGAEEGCLFLINASRAAVGVPAVVRDIRLDAWARGHVLIVAADGRLFHSDLGLLLGAFTALAENVAWASDAASAHHAFVASGPHHRNLSYAGYTRVGIGAAAVGGVTFVVYVFSD